MRRTILLLTAMAVMVASYAGAALAQTAPIGTLDAHSKPVVGTGGPLFDGNVARAQTFSAINSGKLTSVQVYLSLSSRSVVDDSIQVQITDTTASGLPTDNILANETIPVGTVTTSGEFATVNFDNPTDVVAGQRYAIVLRTENGLFVWRWTGLDDPDDGLHVKFGNNPWEATSDTAVFAAYVTSADTTPPQLNLPTDISKTATSSSGNMVNYEASATDDKDGIVTANCSPASGSTFPLGTTPVNCSATDAAGNKATGSFNVSVTYSWGGALQPINGGTTLNDYADDTSSFRLGSTVPVKFKLSGESAGITNATAKLSFTKVSDNVASEAEAGTTAAPTTDNLFRYDATSDQYIYNWGTKGLEPGTYQLEIDLADGTQNTVRVSLR